MIEHGFMGKRGPMLAQVRQSGGIRAGWNILSVSRVVRGLSARPVRLLLPSPLSRCRLYGVKQLKARLWCQGSR